MANVPAVQAACPCAPIAEGGHLERDRFMCEAKLGRCPMKAAPGDRLIIAGDPDRVGEVIAVPSPDGSPPYVVRWRRSGHIALVSPDGYASIVPAGQAIENTATEKHGRE
jgi:Domain of unknown function (DUF1918)